MEKVMKQAMREKCPKRRFFCSVFSCIRHFSRSKVLTEKYITERTDQSNLVGKRNELISKCCHKNKCIDIK